MRRLLVWLAVLSVLVLVGASYPATPALSAATISAKAAEDAASLRRPSPTPTRSGAYFDKSAERPSGTATPTAVPTLSPEGAADALAKLKSHAGQSAVSTRDVPVQLPKQVVVPAIGVDTGIEFVGLLPDGAMDAPKDAGRVAWYRLGPRPGEAGNAVLAGHVDWGGKTAVFWRLGELKPGDLVEVVAADEKRYQFLVQWLRWYDADSAPVSEVFGQGDSPELTIITCGGVFDRKSRQYLSRLVVRAVRR